MTTKIATYYTLVQHTGYTVGKDATFARTVEERSITARQAEQVRKAGGLVFTDYDTAAAAGYNECYPPEVTGLVAKVRGTFAKVPTVTEPVYIPADV